MKYDLTNTTSTKANNMVLEVRRFDWDFDGVPRIWCDNSPDLTHLLNTLSLVAPAFEDWAMPSVRRVMDQIGNADLKLEARSFIGQEAHHSAAHKQFNKEVLVDSHGFDVTIINSDIERLIEYAKSMSDQQQVALVLAGEHFLSNLGDWYLNDVRKNNVIDDKANKLFTWHMVEEIEHSAVVYDVYDSIYGEDPASRIIKYKGMVMATSLVTKSLYKIWKNLMDQENEIGGGPVVNSSMRNFILVMRGAAKYFTRYMSYYSPNFHPWDHNTNVGMLKSLLKEIQV